MDGFRQAAARHLYERCVFHVVKTMQGQEVRVKVGEWIVKETNGPGYYPIAESEFPRTYEPVEN